MASPCGRGSFALSALPSGSILFSVQATIKKKSPRKKRTTCLFLLFLHLQY
jgi:hypothetical protein